MRLSRKQLKERWEEAHRAAMDYERVLERETTKLRDALDSIGRQVRRVEDALEDQGDESFLLSADAVQGLGWIRVVCSRYCRHRERYPVRVGPGDYGDWCAECDREIPRSGQTHGQPWVGESDEQIAAFFQEALDETEGMELPHAYHFLRVKVASRISALSVGEREGRSPSQKEEGKS